MVCTWTFSVSSVLTYNIHFVDNFHFGEKWFCSISEIDEPVILFIALSMGVRANI